MWNSFSIYRVILLAFALRSAVAQGLSGDQGTCLNKCISDTPIAPCAACVSYPYTRSRLLILASEAMCNVHVQPHRMSEPRFSPAALQTVQFPSRARPASTTLCYIAFRAEPVRSIQVPEPKPIGVSEPKPNGARSKLGARGHYSPWRSSNVPQEMLERHSPGILWRHRIIALKFSLVAPAPVQFLVPALPVSTTPLVLIRDLMVPSKNQTGSADIRGMARSTVLVAAAVGVAFGTSLV
ncbi:hypothetical protein C8J57DRAFT_1249794 [Mycena rebaudengoi]|nr:hypothetical protein C8J57DRAFT_1249794 [Mycena rebaudengoi]